MKNYILDENGNPKVELDIMKWAEWFEVPENRVIARDEVNGVRVSTVFLGLDHNFDGQGDPILWETMTFGKGEEQQERYTSKKEALVGHKKIVDSLAPSKENLLTNK